MRLVRCLAGLAVLGAGLGLMVRAELGLSPWDVLHQGLARHTPLTIGAASILVGVLVLAGWLPLRERPGLGTVLNVVVIGVTLDLTVYVVPETDRLAIRLAELAVGVWVWGPGSALYLGARLGPGPRDGLMTGLARRGLPVGPVRTGIELTALAVGMVLGGTAGLGTVAFALGVGPNVAWWLPRLDLGHPAQAGA